MVSIAPEDAQECLLRERFVFVRKTFIRAKDYVLNACLPCNSAE